MANPIFFTVTPGGGVPADRYSADEWAKYKIGSEIELTPVKKRNIRFHRLFMGALRFLFGHQDMYSVFDDFRSDIAIALGHASEETFRGKPVRRAKSISFAQMDEDAFREFFEGFVRLACERISPGLDPKVFDHFLEILDGDQGKVGKRITA